MFDAIKKMLTMEAELIEKFEKDIDLTQEEIDLCYAVGKECKFLDKAINEELPRNVFGRKYRKEGDKYIRDDNGDFISSRGIGGAIWYKLANSPTKTGKKFIGPFGK